MAIVALYSQDANWSELRVSAAASIADNYSKMGSAVGSDAVATGTTDTIIQATGHGAVAGDVIIMTSGGEDGEAREVASVTADAITLSSALSGAPSAAETFNIIRPIQEHSGAGGRILLIKSSLNQDVLLSFDGSEDHIPVEAGDDIQLNLKQNGLHVARSGFIYVKTSGSAPSSGSLWISEVA